METLEETKTEEKDLGLLKGGEIIKWTPQMFEEYFLFTDFFYKDGKIVVNRDTVRAAEQYESNNYVFSQILSRINQYTVTPGWKAQGFFTRLNVTFRTFKHTIQKFPELLNPLTVAKQKDKPQWAWMKTVYDTDSKPAVTAVEVVPATDVVINPMTKMAEALGRVADVYNMIAGTITEKEIKSLGVKDRINALSKLSYIHASIGKFKTSKKLQIINVQKGGKEELEAAIMDFAEDDE